jgi:hypothetical protein
MYIPEEAIDLAMNRNYTVTLCPRKGPSMKCGDRRIWGIREGWQTADLVGARWRNHQVFDDIMDALRRPL